MSSKVHSAEDDFSLDEVGSSSTTKGKAKRKSSHGKAKASKHAAPKKKAKAVSPTTPTQSVKPEPVPADTNLAQPENTPGPFSDFIIGGPSSHTPAQMSPITEPSLTLPAPSPPISYVPRTSTSPVQGQYYLLFMSTPVSSLAHTKMPVDFEKSPIITIGRDAGNTVMLPDQVVSRVHAELTMQDGRIYLRDRGSSNGTYLYDGTNFQQVQDTVEVAPNSVIRFGTTTIVKLTRE